MRRRCYINVHQAFDVPITMLELCDQARHLGIPRLDPHGIMIVAKKLNVKVEVDLPDIETGKAEAQAAAQKQTATEYDGSMQLPHRPKMAVPGAQDASTQIENPNGNLAQGEL